MKKDKDKVPESKKLFTNLSTSEKPDMVDSEEISLFDLHEDMQTVDAIPIEELNTKMENEGDELLEEWLTNESPDNKTHG